MDIYKENKRLGRLRKEFQRQVTRAMKRQHTDIVKQVQALSFGNKKLLRRRLNGISLPYKDRKAYKDSFKEYLKLAIREIRAVKRQELAETGRAKVRELRTVESGLQAAMNRKGKVYAKEVDRLIDKWAGDVEKKRYSNTLKKAKDTVRASIAAGLTKGETIALVRNKFKQSTEADADRIVTTESTRAVAASDYIEAMNSDYVIGWKLVVNYTGCPICDEAEGKFYPKGSKIQDMPPLHPNCECTLEPVFEGEKL